MSHPKTGLNRYGYPSANILLCIWVSAPLGILIAEIVRRKILDVQLNGTKQRGDLAYE